MSFMETGFAQASMFDPAEIEAVRADVNDHIDRVARALHMPFEESLPEAPFAQRLELVARKSRSYAEVLRLAACTDAHRGPRIGALQNDPRLIERAQDVAGIRVGRPIVRVRANVPTLTGNRHGWHSDVSRLDGSGCGDVKLACWIPLMDAGPNTGGLEISAGKRDAPMGHDREQGRWIPDAMLEGRPNVQPDVKMGECLFLDRFTPHRAVPNLTDSARWTVAVWFRALEA
jgi:hypothetical protein